MIKKLLPKRRIQWSRIKTPRDAIAVVTATAFGAGLFPYAPGTMGTLYAVPLAYATQSWATPARLVMWIFLLAAGTWAAKTLDEIMKSEDNQSIVMDEVVGYGITAWTAGSDINTILAAFVLFRILDGLKPWPVYLVDRWSKKAKSPWARGFGVMADDLLAGVVGLIIVVVLQSTGVLK